MALILLLGAIGCRGTDPSSADSSAIIEKREPNFFKRKDDTTLGVWWWGTGNMEAGPERDARMAFLEEHRVTEVYLTYNSNEPDKKFHDFLSLLHGMGIRIYALNGDPSWVTEAGYNSYMGWLEELQKYQDGAAADQRFDGLRIDCEPYGIEEYGKNPTAFYPTYKKLVDSTADFCRKNNMTSAFDVPMWYDNLHMYDFDGKQMLMIDYIIQEIDEISLMSYRDTAWQQYFDSINLINRVKASGKKLVMGSETGVTGEGEFITYADDGPTVLGQELANLQDVLENTAKVEKYGLAVHWIETWFALKDPDPNATTTAASTAAP